MPVLPMLVRAALPSVPLVNQLPGVRKTGAEPTGLARDAGPVTVARAEVERYAALCGFPVKDSVPLTWPHLLGFGPTMDLMTDPAFPAPAIGMVHVENSITAHRSIGIGETVTVEVGVGAPREHRRGTLYDFTTAVSTAASGAGGDVAWEETSTYLRRGPKHPDAPSGVSLPEVSPNGTAWRLPGDLGRRYAAVSGDHNPIHLYPLTAKALGFPRQIAHGMWTLARCVAALENRLPDAVRVDAAFRKPVLLPGSVAFGSIPVDDGYAFSLSSPKSGASHLAGRTAAL